MTTNRHTATGGGVSAAYDASRGTLLFDTSQSRNVGRDYYADGRPMAEYLRTSSSYAPLQPAGIGMYLHDARGERALTFHGTDGQCQTELFRQSIRDESGRMLTDYKADNQGTCNCTNNPCQWTDRFERDYVWVGAYTQMSIKRGDQPHFTALDHLGSPRHQLNSTGSPIGIDVLDAWGNQVSVNQPERMRYTGHERNHVDLDGTSLPISDYMHTRTYVPMLGRFTSPDQKRSFRLFDPSVMNRYAYAVSNPAKYVDPNGLDHVLYVYNTLNPLTETPRFGDIRKRIGGSGYKLVVNSRASRADILAGFAKTDRTDITLILAHASQGSLDTKEGLFGLNTGTLSRADIQKNAPHGYLIIGGCASQALCGAAVAGGTTSALGFSADAQLIPGTSAAVDAAVSLARGESAATAQAKAQDALDRSSISTGVDATLDGSKCAIDDAPCKAREEYERRTPWR